MASIEITLTDACNLNCRYCYEKRRSPSVVEEETMLSLINRAIAECPKNEMLTVNLFGGEPFLQYDLIRSAYKYIETNAGGIEWELGIVTNGTLVHGAIQEWLRENERHIVVTLSIDGVKEAHDENRCGSFDRIDLEFFSKLTRPYAKMTVVPSNLPRMFESLLFLHEKGFKINCSIGYGCSWRESDYSLLDEQMGKYINWAIQNGYDGGNCSLLDFPYMLMERCTGHRYRFCDVGYSHTYNVDGSRAPCHMLLNNSLSDGDIEAIGRISFPSIELTRDQLDPKCDQCPIITVCQSCYANNYFVNGDIYKQDEDICRANRILFKRRSEFAAMQWKNGLDIGEREERALIEAVLKCQELKCE